MLREATEQELERLPPIDPGKYRVIVVDLADVPHHETVLETRRGIHGSEIDVYEVDDLAVVTSSGEWSPVKYWTRHRSNLLEIVDLDNGMQLYTDDDPRAIFGYHPDTGEEVRMTPTDALLQDVVIPVKPFGVDYREPFDGQETFDCFEDAYKRHCGLKLDGVGPTRIDYIDGVFALSSAEFETEKYARVVGVQETGHEVTGYDLTVPGYETFMNSDGVILSNTLGIFIPSLPESVQDVKDNLMPSRQIFSIRDPDKVVNQPKQDLLLGLYNASTGPSKNTHVFNTREDALRAIRQGRVSLSDEVHINEE